MIVRLAEIPIERSWSLSMERAVRTAEKSPIPDVLVLPELFTIGFVLDRIEDNALSLQELRELPLSDAAERNGMWIVGGTFPVRTERGIVNMLPVFDTTGELVHTTEKTHLFTNMGEDTVFTPGIPAGVFKLKGVTAGASVCYDLRFPELFRRHALMDARILFLPAQWPESRIELFRSFLMARAGEAQVYAVGCNLGGDHLGVRFRGGGGIAHPSGRLISGEDVDEYTKDYDINLDEVSRIREKINCLSDRRPEVYGGCE